MVPEAVKEADIVDQYTTIATDREAPLTEAEVPQSAISDTSEDDNLSQIESYRRRYVKYFRTHQTVPQS
jgi:hypothetical protein